MRLTPPLQTILQNIVAFKIFNKVLFPRLLILDPECNQVTIPPFPGFGNKHSSPIGHCHHVTMAPRPIQTHHSALLLGYVGDLLAADLST